jgi:two-component system cell cycle response regulator DivK
MKRRVLIVEDNETNRELLRDWLEAEGYEVLSAENLERARAVFADQQPHAVLLDIQLGGEDGLSFASWARRHSKVRDIPVIAVTAHAMVTDQARIMQAGCHACVPKPIDFKLLRQQLDRWIGHVERLQ